MAFSSTQQGHESSQFTVSDAPPSGFEDLAAAQTTLVDVVFGNRVVASVMATYELNQFQFDQPEQLFTAIADLKENPELISVLTGALASNSEYLCHSDYQTQCGELKPDVAGVIFDETRFRAFLFVDPSYLETHYLENSPYLPRSNSQAATVHGFSLSASGDELSGNLINLSGQSLFSWRESRLQALYDVDSRDGLSVDTLSFKHDTRGWEYELGAFRSQIQGFGFLTEQNLLGARVATSLNTRTDLDNAQASPLFVYLEQRSRVDIFRGKQLVDSRFYPAGNQQLDTARLPDGAYNISVKIAADSGAHREEVFYFSRSSALPPLDQPYYFAELAQPAEARLGTFPSGVDGHWLRAGTARRLSHNFGVEATVNLIGEAKLIEAGAVWLAPNFQLQGTLLSGDATGYSLRSLWSKDLFTLSADIRRLTGDETINVNALEILSSAYTQANVTASMPFLSGRLLARARWNQRRQTQRDSSFGFSYFRDLRRFQRSVLSLNVDTLISSDDRYFRLGVDWRWRKNRTDALFQPRLQATRTRNGEVTTDSLLNVQYNHRYTVNRTTDLSSSVFLDSGIDSRSVGVRLAAESARGNGDIEAQYGFGNERQGLAYSSNARFGVVSSGTHVAFGGRRGHASSVIIAIDGNASNAVFEVFVDRQSYGYAEAGRRTIISLTPYATYDISLESIGDVLVNFEQSTRSVTLYPGNVETLSFKATKQVVIVGQAFLTNGSPAANFRFDEVEGFASTDENGWFQIEVTQITPLTLIHKKHGACTVKFPLNETDEKLLVYEALTCTPVPRVSKT